MENQLSTSELVAFLAIAEGNGGLTDTAMCDRIALYRWGLIKNTEKKTVLGNRVLTERGEAFFAMLRGTPLPVEVSTPRWVDPRSK